jgi:hypothetical protein
VGETPQETTIAAIAARLAAMEGRTPAPPRAAEDAPASRVGSALASGMFALGSGAGAAAFLRPAASAEEIAQAVSVAVAYFEDTLETAPQRILSAGTLGADALAKMLGGVPTTAAGAARVEEMASGGANGGVPAGWLAGVQGALRS